MPLFEYTCKQCDRDFELLMRAQETPACPACRGTDLQRKLSTFAARTGSAAGDAVPAGACGACGDPRGPGACSLN